MKRQVVTALVAVGALLGGCSSGGNPVDPPRVDPPDDSTPAPDATVGIEPDLADFYTQTLKWSSCGGEFQCTTLEVPLDYADPDGDTIDLSVLRSPAEDPEGSLIVNPGGPGASGVDYARAARSLATDAVREHYDIVGFDPRGVGESNPVDCLDDEQLDAFTAAEATPDDDEEVAELQGDVEEFAAGCESRSGALLPHLSTENAARDMDVLRAALGDSKLTYLGKSYGTYLGAIYADLFPSRVGRMVLDGAIDPSLSAKEFALGQAAGFQRAWDGFVRWCVDDGCPLGDDEDEVQATVSAFLSDLDEEPLQTGDDSRPLTESLAFYGMVVPFYSPASEAYPTVRDALDQAINDDSGAGLLALADLYLSRNGDGTYTGNSNEVFAAVNCLDRPESPTIEQVSSGLSDYEEASPVFGPFMAWGALTCAAWPVKSSAVPGPLDATGADPILVIGTTGDPATPYPWAEALADQLSSGELLTYDGTGHTAYRSGSECVDEFVDAYLVEGELPGKRQC